MIKCALRQDTIYIDAQQMSMMFETQTMLRWRGILSNALTEFIQFWQKIYQENNVIEALYSRQAFIGVPEGILDEIQMAVHPEPYYGYLHEDTSDDVLLLLLNPGHVDESNVAEVMTRNQRTQERYAHPWKKEEYLLEEERLKTSEPWRSIRSQQAHNIVGPFGFLHTIEFFPFHSTRFPSQLSKPWVYHVLATELAFKAVRELAVQRGMKHILSIGRSWEMILRNYKVPLMADVRLIRHGSKRFSFKFVSFKFAPHSLPITVSILGSGAMNLPADPFAVQVLQTLLHLNS